MKNKFKKLIPAILSAFVCGGMATGIAACGHEHTFLPNSDEHGHWTECKDCEVKTDVVPHKDDDGDGKCDECEYVMTTEIAVTGITLNKNSTTLAINGTETLTANVLPANATNRTVSWTSSNTAVAEVDQNGKVTAKAAGTANITATAGGKSDSCTVTVNGAQTGDTGITSVNFTQTSLTLNPTDTKTLVALVFGDSNADKTLTWASSNDAVAEVDQNGKVTAKAAGTANITATAGGKTATCVVTVEAADTTVPVTNITLDKSSDTLFVNDSVTLAPTVSPQNATNKTVTWSSSNELVALVDQNGKVSAVGAGTATITARAGNHSAVFVVTVKTAETTQSYNVTYMDGATTVKSVKVMHGAKETPPPVSKEGSYFGGWFDNPSFNGTAYNFDTPISSTKTFYAKWIKLDAKLSYTQAGYEAASFEWTDTNAGAAQVEYKLTTETTYAKVDSELIRNTDGSTARADVIGLKGGKEYDFKIRTSAGDNIEVTKMAINSFDRSGYAHFDRQANKDGSLPGIGAYNDDGTLKENTLVIYLTESNKNDILDSCYVNGQKADISQYMRGADGTQYRGIGELLNNRRYSGNDRMGVGIAKLSQVYSGGVNIRVLGKVEAEMLSGGASSITGLTDYNSTGNGGSLKDNGRMARITNAKNLTIEGIGEDAMIFGWGVHFINSDTLHHYEGAGKGFEVRNVTFKNYPEDAVGMEGVQAATINADGSTNNKGDATTAKLYAPVERCWVHNNTFLPGYCANPAESDKAEGDGSCDFKRGQYFTCSYNYFEDCHKTNLVGANKDTLQYNLSYHHNYWYNCKARQPLARNANIHFYNNFAQYSSDTVMSIRANAYLFAEGNYYEGCKNPTEFNQEGSSTIKLFNNTFYACYDFKGGKTEQVKSRDTYVANNCKYTAGNIDYSHFDTNPEQFYYNAETKTSDCYITDSATARADCIRFSGAQKRDYALVNTRFTEMTPSKALTIPKDGLTIDLSKVSVNGGEVDGVLFANLEKASGGTVTGEKQFVAFTVADRTDITFTAEGGNEYQTAEFLKADGTLVAGKVTSYSGTIEAGTYIISSGQIDASGKNTRGSTLKSLSFKSGVTDDEKVQNVIKYINDIGTVELTEACREKINAAQAAYDALGSALQEKVTNASVLAEKTAQYNTLIVAPVIRLINDIGTVNENSGEAISRARNAYNVLTDTQKSAVTNYNVLVAAETSYAEFAVIGLNNQIAGLPATSTATTRAEIEALLDKYEAAKTAYEGLDEDKRAQITDYAKVTNGIAALNAALKPYELKEMIAALPESTSADYIAKVGAAKTVYDSLNATQKAVLTADEKSKIETAIAAYDEYMSRAVTISFTSGHDNYYTNSSVSSHISVSGSARAITETLNGVTYSSGIKMESSTSITINAGATERKLVLHFASGAAGTIKDSAEKVYTIESDRTVTITLAAGQSITLTKKDGTSNVLFLLEILPA